MMYRLVAITFLLLTVVWAEGVRIRNGAPQFALADVNGRSVRLSDYKGKVVLLDFWATWCGGCKTEIPWYEEFAEKYKSQGLRVIGVAMDDTGVKTVKPFVVHQGMNYPVVLGNDHIAQLYRVHAMPETLLIDRDGGVVTSHVGVVDKEKLEQEIRIILQGR